MTAIKLRTDGERFKQLVEMHESQIEAFYPLEEEKKVLYEASCRAIWDLTKAAKEDTADARRRLPELEKISQDAEKACSRAYHRSEELITAASLVCVDIVAELIHDNIDALDGMDINSKDVFLAINGALPENIFVDTNMRDRNPILYVKGGGASQSLRMKLVPSEIRAHIMCCSKGGHFIDRNRFLSDYEKGEYRYDLKDWKMYRFS